MLKTASIDEATTAARRAFVCSVGLLSVMATPTQQSLRQPVEHVLTRVLPKKANAVGHLSWRPHSRASAPRRARSATAAVPSIDDDRASNDFFVPRRLVATALLARDRAAIVSFDRGGHHAAVSPWADGDAAWADADGDV